ncbi:MAG: hypothetical protein H6739_29595 [Alphaproteobacteria bacterium]|nr:hypothetical protein [Alphaproteobacteria bacterium]
MRAPLLLLPAALIGCAAPAEDPDALGLCEPSSSTRAAVVTQLRFARELKDGIADGFDLDGIETRPGSSSGCGIPDFTSPRFEPGIDNAFANLVPALELTEAQAIEPLIQETINSGELLMMFELEGIDDDADDPCVDVHLLRGDGPADVSAAGRLLPGQTFDRALDQPSALAADVALVDGVLVARGVDFSLPLTVLGVELDFAVQDAGARIVLTEDGGMRGVFGGGVSVDYLLDLARENIAGDQFGTVEALLGLASDLDADGDGACEQISIAFLFEAVSAHFYEDSMSYEE